MYQKVLLIGYVGRDPELKYLPSGKAICNFSVATSERRFDADGNASDHTTWWRVTAWGKTAEAVEKYVKKGSKVLVDGKMNPDTNGNPRVFQKQDGSWHANYEMDAQTVRFLDGKQEEDEGDGQPY